MGNIDVSIIIVNYNTCKITDACISSILEKTRGIDYEIILVDNASTDGSKAFFEEDRRVIYIYSETNGGFGAGNNIGMKCARGKYFFLLNSDTILINNAVKEFYDYAEEQGKLAVYGCWLVDGLGRRNCSCFPFPAFTIKDFFKRLIKRRKTVTRHDLSCKVDAVAGADMFFHRETVEKVGLFDEKIFLYGEEGELQYRMKNEGIGREVIPTPQICHLEGKSMQESIAKQTISIY